jgi:hypothetical protein
MASAESCRLKNQVRKGREAGEGEIFSSRCSRDAQTGLAFPAIMI